MFHKLKAIQLSNRTFCFLRMVERYRGLSLNQMLGTSQTTAGACVRRNLVRWVETHQKFELTALGDSALSQFKDTDISRHDSSRPLSQFIDTPAVQRRLERIRNAA